MTNERRREQSGNGEERSCCSENKTVDEKLFFIIQQLGDIESQTTKINSRIHRRYTKEDHEEILKSVENREKDAIRLFDCLIAKQGTEETDEIKANNVVYQRISNTFNKERIKPNNRYTELLHLYNELNYSFRTAKELTKNQISEEINPIDINKSGIILLFKNVRILEDLINKICTNNIDKSIVSGEQHFDSIRYGLEWLFCHEELSGSSELSQRRQLDIRDTNRYLDYIKYHIMCSSTHVDSAPQSPSDIDQLYEKIRDMFNKKEYTERIKYISKFKNSVKELICAFSEVYEVLIKFRDALLLEEEIRKSLAGIGKDASANDLKAMNLEPQDLRKVINLSSVAVRVMIDRFVSFVKINNLNFGNSTFYRGWFNYSELSNSNYAGSDFKYARIENAKMKECDISTCNLILADCGYTDFSYSYFNYSNMTGINLVDATANYCEFQNAAFLDPNIELYKNAISEVTKDKDNFPEDDKGRKQYKRLKQLSNVWCTDWKTDLSIESLLSDIVECYKNQKESQSLNVQGAGLTAVWSILHHGVNQNLKIELYDKTKDLLRRFLNMEISDELLISMRELFANESNDIKTQRVNRYGDILLDVADMNSITAKHSMLGGNNLSHVNMNGASFENADMSGVRLYYSHSRVTAFIRTNLNKTNCFESDFYLASFANAAANNALFINCNMNHTNWNRAILVGTTFMDASQFLENIIFEERTQSQALITEQCIKNRSNALIILDQSSYKEWIPWGNYYKKLNLNYWQTDCGIKDATFEEALADNTVFLNMIADRSRFNRASLRNSTWANCRAFLSDFVKTDLRYSSFSFCCVGQSDFSCANICNAVLSYVDFSGCNLRGAQFNQCKMDHILIQNANVRDINITGAKIENSAFENCDFIGTIVSDVVFSNCVFSNVDFYQLRGFISSTFNNCVFYDSQYSDNLDDSKPIRLHGKVDPREECEYSGLS